MLDLLGCDVLVGLGESLFEFVEVDEAGVVLVYSLKFLF